MTINTFDRDPSDDTAQRWDWSDMIAVTRTVLLWTTVVIIAAAPWFPSSANDDLCGPVILLGAVQSLILAARLAISRKLPRSGALVLVGALMAWLAWTTQFSIAPHLSIRLLAVWWGGAAVFFGLLLARPSVRQLRQVTLFLVTAMVGLSLFGLARACLTGLGFTQAFSATYSNSDCFAALLLMALGLGLGLVPLSTMAQNQFLLADLLVLFCALVSTGSRSGVVGALVMVVLVVSRRLLASKSRVKSALLPLLGGVAVMAVAGWVLAGPMLMARFEEAFTRDGAEAWSVRWIVLSGWFATWLRSPWVGHGLGTFALAFEQDRPHGLFVGYINQAHVDLVQIVVETGVVGLTLLLGLIGTAVVSGWRCRATPSVIGPVAGLVGVCVYGLVNFALPVPADLIWFFALLGLVFAHLQAAAGREPLMPRRHSHGWCGMHVTVGVLVVLFVVTARAAADLGLRTVQGVRAHDAALQSAEAQAWLPAVERCSEAIDLDPDNEDYYRTRAGLLESIGQAHGNWSLVSSAKDDYLTALRKNPRRQGVPLEVALMLERWGDTAKAEQVLLQGTRAYPEDPGNWSELGRMALVRWAPRQSALLLWAALQNDSIPGSALAKILQELECQKAGAGVQLLRRFAAERQLLTTDHVVELSVEAANLCLEQDPAASMRLVQEALACSSQNPAALLVLANLQMLQGNTLPALNSLQHLATVTDKPLPDLFSGFIHNVSQHPSELEKAARLVKAYLRQYPSDNVERSELASLYWMLQDVEAAIRTYREAIQEAPSDATLYVALGDVLAQRGDRRHAHLLYLRAAVLDPANDAYQQKVTQSEDRSSP